MDSNKNQKKYTVCFLFTPNLEYVLLQRKKKTDFAGLLNGVGGKLEDGETPEQCAIREIREETGAEEIRALTWLGTLSLPDNCDTHAFNDDVSAPTCILHYYAAVLHDSKDIIVTYAKSLGAEELIFMGVKSVISAAANDTQMQLAGNGDLQYFVQKGLHMLKGKMDDGTAAGTFHKLAAVHYAGENDKLVLAITLVQTNDGSFDPRQAIADATAEYLDTEDGKETLGANNGDFNYGDFISCVPDSICARHGFRLHSYETYDEVVDHNESLAPQRY